jgi:cytochrome P450 family 4
VSGAFCSFVPIVGDLPEYAVNFKKHGDACYSIRNFVTQHPDARLKVTTIFDTLSIELFDLSLIKEFLTLQAKDTMVKDLRVLGHMLDIARKGILFSEKEAWKAKRKLLSQVFHFNYVNECMPTIARSAQEWIDRYSKGSEGGIVNLHQTMPFFPATVLWRIFLGEDQIKIGKEAEDFVNLIIKASIDFFLIALSPFNLIFGSKFVKLGLREIDRRYLRDFALIEKLYLEKVLDLKQDISNRKKSGAPERKPKPLVELILEHFSEKKNEKPVTDFDIISDIQNFSSAGIDSTMITINMCHYVLATRPEEQDKLRGEIKNLLGDSQILTLEQLTKMDYLNAFIKEVLRYYPPVPKLFSRIAEQDFMLGDIHVQKGFVLNVNIYGVQRNSRYFEDPNVFRPERWLKKDGLEVKDQAAYLAFFAGGRRCIGEQLAMIETKVILCELLRRFRISLNMPYELRIENRLICGPADDIKIIYSKL